MSTDFNPSARDAHGDADTLVQDVRAELACGNIERARAMAELGRASFPESEALQRMSTALAKPHLVRKGIPPSVALSLSQLWLREHAAEYRGQWVAVSGDRLLCAAPTLGELRKSVDVTEDVLVTKIA